MRALLVASSILATWPAAARSAPGASIDAVPGAQADDAAPGRALCTRGVRHRGAAIDLDVKGADIHDVFRLIADVGRVNVVVPDDVTGKVTLRLVRVPWESAACVVAAVHRLTIHVDGNILLVMPAARPK